MAGSPKDTTPYLVVARRFRPQTFSELVGQDDVLQSLRSALGQQRIPHAFLFSGSRGVGKTTSARILARCLNCEKGPTPEPCGVCEQCVSIKDGTNPDIIEIDAASNNGVDDVRALREHTAFASMRSRYKVFILDEAHMLSRPAFNALLKTLEEPPPGVVFVLATTELHKVPETIRSRCQVLLFRRVGEVDLIKRLEGIVAQEGVAVPSAVLSEIANAVRGGVRDAETALERVLPLAREMGERFDLAAYRSLVARLGGDAAVEVAEALLAGDVASALRFARSVQQDGLDEREVLGELVEVLRNALLLKVDGPDSTLVEVAGAARERLRALAGKADASRLDAMIAAGLLGRERIKRMDDRGVVLDLTLVRMAQAGALPSLADLVAELRGAPARSVAASRPAAAPALGVGDLTARLKARYQADPRMARTVEGVRLVVANDGARIDVHIVATERMYRDRLESPDVRAELNAALRELHGREALLEWHSGTAAPPAATSAAAAPGTAPTPGATVRGVLGAFRGRVVQVNPEDRGAPAAEPATRPDDEPPTPED